MALYLWHVIPVVIVAIVGYTRRLLPQPPEGTADWWLARLKWVVILSLVTAFELVLLWWGRRLFAAPLPTLGIPLPDRWGEPLMLAGAAMAAYGLGFFAAEGFAPDGHFPGSPRGLRRRGAAGRASAHVSLGQHRIAVSAPCKSAISTYCFAC